MRTRTITRWITVVLMAVVVLAVTADGFAQSYAGLLDWAHEHKVTFGWRADSFPLLVDAFIAVGEMGLFLLALDGHRLTRRGLPWVDLALPAGAAVVGWSASLAFNVGRVHGDLSDRVTAAVPPVAAMVGLVILLRTLHRYTTATESASDSPLQSPVHPAEPNGAQVHRVGSGRPHAYRAGPLGSSPQRIPAGWLSDDTAPLNPAEPAVHLAGFTGPEPAEPELGAAEPGFTAEPDALAASLPEKAVTRDDQVQFIVNLIREVGSGAVNIDVVQRTLGLKKTTAHYRLKAARERVNREAS